MVFPTLLPRVDESTSSAVLSALSRIGPLLVSPQNARSIAEKLEAEAEWIVECESSEQVEDALNGPASKVIIGEEIVSSIGDEFKRDVILRLSTIQGKEDQLDGLAGIVLPSSIDKAQIKSIRQKLVAPGLIFIESDTTTTADLVPLVPASSLTPESIAKLFISDLSSDRPDGLYPTIVSTPSSSPSPALGLVYSSGESITESIITGKGVYQSRKHGLWRKGETSGSTQRVVRIRKDCDQDALVFEVEQTGTGFCHLETRGCFSLDAGRAAEKKGLEALEGTLQSRLTDAPAGSYTSRLFNDPKLLSQKIMEEAEELVDASDSDPSHIAFEMADLLYFAMVKCVKAGVSLKDVERNLDEKAQKGKKGIRRTGDAKSKWIEYGKAKEEGKKANETDQGGDKILGVQTVEAVGKDKADEVPAEQVVKAESKPDAPVPKAFPTSADDHAAGADAPAEMIRMRTSDLGSVSRQERQDLLKRPVMDSSAMIERVKPIVSKVREGGDEALKALTKQFDRSDLESNVLLPPFYPPPNGQELSTKITDAIEQAYANVKAFHEGQAEKEPLVVETMPGVVCTRFARPIDRVGIYVPGGTAILPSTALMLGVPAQVAGCTTIVLATPPRPDGSISPEVLYVAKLVGVDVILKAGGAQAVAAMAYGTETCPKVDKIFGPGNQWVTAAKMLVQNDTQALVGIDMPAGPSEVMVIADKTANPVFVASDLLSQAEHGIDSQVVLVAIDLSTELLETIEQEVDKQANALPRVDIIRQAIKKSLIVKVQDIEEAFQFSNEYAPEHLILHLEKSSDSVKLVNNAGSVFVGAFSPESCGDYASGTNHTLPTYGYAKQFSGVNTLSFQKHITSQELTEDGLRALGPIVVTLAECEGLEAHANAVRVRLATLQ